jgi:hypothetical protein
MDSPHAAARWHDRMNPGSLNQVGVGRVLLLASSGDDRADGLAVFDVQALPAGDLESV